MKEFWDERYKVPEYAYGELPNEYFKEQLDKLTAGKILLPAEGEGRNAVYAASKGWQVTAFDWSVAGKQKAEQLAEKHGVTINYLVGDLASLTFEAEQFDAIGLIYAHFTTESISDYHKLLQQFVRKGGHVILEAFSKNHTNYKEKNPRAGGPTDKNMLYSVEQIREDFKGFECIELIETETTLEEGYYHQGLGSVIRFLGTK